MPVLYGVFLYMGVASLKGMQVNILNISLPTLKHNDSDMATISAIATICLNVLLLKLIYSEHGLTSNA